MAELSAGGAAGLLLASPPSSETDRAAVMALDAVAGLGERTGDTLSPFHQWLIAKRSAAGQRLLLKDEWQAAWQVRYAWTQEQAIAATEKWLATEVNG